MDKKSLSRKVWHIILTGIVAVSSLFGIGGQTVRAQAKDFADPAFQRIWKRADLPVAQARVSRSWVWGPAPGKSMQEPFKEGPSGMHLVQYFDKARMEMNDPRKDSNDPFYVTNGLLVVDMISGRAQIGVNEFEPSVPYNQIIAGDSGSNAPTYATLRKVASAGLPGQENRAASLTAGTLMPSLFINEEGEWYGLPPSAVPAPFKVGAHVKETGHNIPDLFWDYLNLEDVIYQNGSYSKGKVLDWVSAFGYPITEPYWTRIMVAGEERLVLFQAFQRRILTYSPTNPLGWQVEMSNVGLHYYTWRYENGSGNGRPANCWTTTTTVNGNTINTLRSVAAISGEDAWAVGGGPQVALKGGRGPQTLHWDGAEWKSVPSNIESAGELTGVAALSTDNVWAIGTIVQEGGPYNTQHVTLALHWNGTQWDRVPTPNPSTYINKLSAIVAIAPDDIWAVGYYYDLSLPAGSPDRPLTMHWDGNQWNLVSTPDVIAPQGLKAVAASHTDDVWAVGGTLIMHWDGHAWNISASPVSGQLNGVAVLSKSDAWVVGSSPQGQHTISLHWNGTKWTQVPSPNPGPTDPNFFFGNLLSSIYATSPENVWALGYYVRRNVDFQSQRWQPLLLHWDGTAWQQVDVPPQQDSYVYSALAALPSNKLWITGYQLHNSPGPGIILQSTDTVCQGLPRLNKY